MRRRIAARGPNHALLRLRRVRGIDARHRSYPPSDAAGGRVWIGRVTERLHRAASTCRRLTSARLVQILKMLVDSGRWSGGKARQQSWWCVAGIDRIFAKSPAQLRRSEGMVNPPYSTIGRRLIESPATTILNLKSTTIIFWIVFSSADFTSPLQERIPGIVLEIEIGIKRPDFNLLECLGAIFIDDDPSRNLCAFVSNHECAQREVGRARIQSILRYPGF